MKIGCCANMLATGGDAVGMRYISRIKELGYDYVELPLAQVMELDDNAAARLERILLENDMRCECFNNFFPPYIRLTGPYVSAAQIERYIDQSLRKAERFSAKIVVFGSSGARNIPPGYKRSEAFEQAAETLRAVARRAGEMGITIAIECLNRVESNFINNLGEGFELMEAVNVPQVKLLVDYFHFAHENETLAALEQHIDDIVHVHIAHAHARLIPEGDGDCARFIQKLRQLGYDSRISLEAAYIYPEPELEEGLRWLRRRINIE